MSRHCAAVNPRQGEAKTLRSLCIARFAGCRLPPGLRLTLSLVDRGDNIPHPSIVHPFTQTIGFRRATRQQRPASSAAATTAVTSL